MKPKQYLPSSGTEGEQFMTKFCNRCKKEKRCKIIVKSYGGYVSQWIYKDDKPTCTSFRQIGTTEPKRYNQALRERYLKGRIRKQSGLPALTKLRVSQTRMIFIDNEKLTK